MSTEQEFLVMKESSNKENKPNIMKLAKLSEIQPQTGKPLSLSSKVELRGD